MSDSENNASNKPEEAGIPEERYTQAILGALKDCIKRIEANQ